MLSSLTMREGKKVLGVLHTNSWQDRLLIKLCIRDPIKPGVHRVRNTDTGYDLERVEHNIVTPVQQKFVAAKQNTSSRQLTFAH
jgi:hypothetical protein